MVIKNPIVVNCAQMLEELEAEPQRAAYMVIKELYELQRNVTASQNKE